MQALLTRWSTVKQSKFKYGQGISSSDYLHMDQDATQLDTVPDVSQVSKQRGTAPNTSAQNGQEEEQEILSSVHSRPADIPGQPSNHRSKPAHHLTPTTTVDEFGALPSGSSSQKAINGHHMKASTESRLLPSKSTRNSIVSTMPRKASSRAVSTAMTSSSSNAATAPMQPSSYGYTNVGWDHQMDVSRAVEIVMACSEQIRIRGLDSPLLFSSMALDLSHHAVTSLIQSIMQSPASFISTDVKYANPHDLAAIIKWTLARLGRVYPVPIPVHERTKRKGVPQEETVLVHQRGFLDIESYIRWAGQERKNEYPMTSFTSFLNTLSPSSLALLVAVFSLLSSTTAYSLKNGMTPSRLSRLFGPLLFGLPEDETFEKTYDAFVKAGNATEHLLLAYIRDASTVESLPVRLAEHIRKYPSMLSLELHLPSRNVRGVAVTHVNRTVRLYSLDLVQTACEMDVSSQCPEWQSCCSTSGEKEPQLSDRYRKLLNIRGNRKQGRASMATLDSSEEIVPYESLADKKWGDFMSEGFSAPDTSKLTFDLNQSHRKVRSQRPGSVQWSQFEKSGFLEEEKGLESVLSFDDGLHDDIQRWPLERVELNKQLRKTSKMMPSFPYDTVPYVVSSPTLDVEKGGQWDKKPISKFDEVFAEVYADVLLGNGWTNRDEQTHRTANFVIVQYKSRPTASTVASQSIASFRSENAFLGSKDDRSDAAWFVVEEIIPAQYRSELEAAGHKGSNLASLRKLNIFKRKERDLSRGYGVQSDPIHPPSSAFDELLKPGLGGVTKRVQLGRDPAIRSTSTSTRRDSGSTVRQGTIHADDSPSMGGSLQLMRTLTNKLKRRTTKEEDDNERGPATPSKVGMAASPSFSSADYETRSVHELGQDQDDEGANQSTRRRLFLKSGRHAKKESRDDSWLDVMLRSNTYKRNDTEAARRSYQQFLGVAPSHTAQSVRSITPVRSSSLRREVPVMPGDESATESQALGLHLSPPSHGDATPRLSHVSSVKRKPSPSAEEALEAEVEEGGVSKDTISAAGWTVDDPMKDSSATMAPLTPPKDGKMMSLATPEKVFEIDSDAGTPRDADEVKVEETLSHDGGVSIRPAHLKPLPPKSADRISIDERERAREMRIEAARERARELRANLKPVAFMPAEQVTSTTEPIAIPDTTAMKGRLSSSPVPSSELPSGSSPLGVKAAMTPKDDPFSRDRVSGRVASVASKFGGVTLKPVTPPAAGVNKLSSSPGRASVPAVPASQSPSAPALPLPQQGGDGSLSRSVDSQADLTTSRSNDYNMSMDQSEIYPEDAASNFSRDTTFDEGGGISASNSRDGNYYASLRPGGSIAASSPIHTTSFDVERQEEEDQAMGMTTHRIPYTPGMPLSNLEEESESVLSGSNI